MQHWAEQPPNQRPTNRLPQPPEQFLLAQPSRIVRLDSDQRPTNRLLQATEQFLLIQSSHIIQSSRMSQPCRICQPSRIIHLGPDQYGIIDRGAENICRLWRMKATNPTPQSGNRANSLSSGSADDPVWSVVPSLSCHWEVIVMMWVLLVVNVLTCLGFVALAGFLTVQLSQQK
jgi:hypothetical protein